MPASPSVARAVNDRAALLLLRDGPLTAGELASRTGLSRPTIAELVRRLGDAGLVTVVGEVGERRRGPNATLYGIVRDRAHVAALDLRTDSVSVVVGDLLGTVLAEASVAVEPSNAVSRTVELVRETAGAAMHAVGVGVPGLVDPVTGDVRGVPPRWHSGAMGELRRRLPGQLLVENETNMAALAEHRVGNARDRDTFALLWLGSGAGAAFVLGGALHRGASGGAGELGYLPLGDNGFQPTAAIVALGLQHGLAPHVESPEPPAATMIRAAVADGAGSFLDAVAERVAVGAATITAVLDPGCVVLGGELGHAGGTELADRVAARLAARSPIATEVRPSALGGEAVLRGALLTACEAAQNDLFGHPSW